MSTHQQTSKTAATLAHMSPGEARRSGVNMQDWREARDARTARMHAADKASLVRVG